ncbi:MAG: hypothetical protein U0556_03235 [Dehalococcoidia bacterium]
MPSYTAAFAILGLVLTAGAFVLGWLAKGPVAAFAAAILTLVLVVVSYAIVLAFGFWNFA